MPKPARKTFRMDTNVKDSPHLKRDDIQCKTQVTNTSRTEFWLYSGNFILAKKRISLWAHFQNIVCEILNFEMLDLAWAHFKTYCDLFFCQILSFEMWNFAWPRFFNQRLRNLNFGMCIPLRHAPKPNSPNVFFANIKFPLYFWVPMTIKMEAKWGLESIFIAIENNDKTQCYSERTWINLPAEDSGLQ